MSRLVVVSNRVGPIRDAARAGGLAVALIDALRREGGLWFGWSGNVSENSDELNLEHHGPLTLATADLSEEDYQEYYNGFANSTLWPLFHYRLDLASFERRDFQGYMRVNRSFARMLVPLLEPSDLIWVHDYHFLAFGEELRRLGCEQRIGFFLHIPFPAPEIFITLPGHEALVRAMFAYDLVGFQTESDRRAFIHYVVDEAGGRILDGDRVRAFGRTIQASVFSIGIDTENFARFTSSADSIRHYERMKKMVHDRVQIIGVDRLDYTKGLPQRFAAVENLLERYPENCGRVLFMQIAPPSRADVEQYIQIRRQLEMAAGHINGQFSQFDWTPIRYLNRAFSRRALSGLYRASKVGLVTPLRDGMNLVAKEYVAAQDPQDPGVLVLSRFAGAVRQMSGALIVNPYDVEAVADALQQALHMPQEERKDRWSTMMQRLRREDVDAWRATFLAALRTVEMAH